MRRATEKGRLVACGKVDAGAVKKIVPDGVRRRDHQPLAFAHDAHLPDAEIVGPVVCVQSFDDDDLDQVAKFANDTEYGLQASIWTHNLKVAHSLARKIKAGTICVNTHNYGDPAWPFGGFKQSGWGREMGKEVMEHYTETKSVAINLV